jgi:hypothetical protein
VTLPYCDTRVSCRSTGQCSKDFPQKYRHLEEWRSKEELKDESSLRQCCAGDILEPVKVGGTAKMLFSTLSSRMAETRKHSRIEPTSPTNCLAKGAVSQASSNLFFLRTLHESGSRQTSRNDCPARPRDQDFSWPQVVIMFTMISYNRQRKRLFPAFNEASFALLGWIIMYPIRYTECSVPD